MVQYSSTNDVVVNLSGGKSTKRAALLTPSAAAAKDGYPSASGPSFVAKLIRTAGSPSSSSTPPLFSQDGFGGVFFSAQWI